ncbi:energy-coupling factor transporter transmembrane component T [Microbacterium enclense]|uniref:energy-coupling factor transporter transmembrane component T n=1 Tax=Microbacterium enclense TaxID=993073 RepID=UPI0036DE7C50
MTADLAAPPRPRPLKTLNPLAKLAAPLPAMLALVFVRDLVAPSLFLGAALVVLLCGARLTRRTLTMLFVVVPAAVVVVSLGFAIWVDTDGLDAATPLVRIGDWTLTDGALLIGLATGLRLAAIMTLAFIGGLTTTGADLVRALVQQLRVPYRIGYAALAAIRFVPRFAVELRVIRQAHRVRGTRGPVRAAGYVVPLLAGAIRHAERVALAMDARAFGAHRDRTERHLVPVRRRDVVFVLAFWVISVVILALAGLAG